LKRGEEKRKKDKTKKSREEEREMRGGINTFLLLLFLLSISPSKA
jgi:hypothetical protein